LCGPKQQYLNIIHKASQHGELYPTAEIDWRISTAFASWFRYCTEVAQRRSSKLCTMFGGLLGWYTVYTFLGLLSPNGILPGAKSTLRPRSTLRPSLAFYVGNVTTRHSSSARQPIFAAWDKEIPQGGHHVVLPCHTIMAALCNYIFVLWFLLLLSSSFPRLFSAVADWMSTIVLHMVWP